MQEILDYEKETRKINVDGKEYVYVLRQKYNGGECHITVRIYPFLKKKSALTFHFSTWDDPIAGGPLYTGVNMLNKNSNRAECMNLNHPARIEQLVNYGVRKGWTGDTAFEFHHGLDIIAEMGYEIAWLKPGLIG
ncbi:hypothetical protein NDS46_15900 [Paenibacillus thiaminolyticus]|uniref:hypothetical protein n=1 Tax=Paenibacillus thiaminolyticus TaxID=49283 RepID=UPI00232F2A79|nr:hypothetical protein [Paenibacillus thiaminolyticus]WCF05872.1 hypothetical protein NDS46_15900 [Paenibacillus thiaminolyticus]